MARILALRLSALGDLAMAVPAIYSFAVDYPNDEITIVTRKSWSALFQEMPSNVCFYGIDIQEYSGLRGLAKLYKELSKEHFDCVADLHDVIRTKYLAFRFRLANVPVAVINKEHRAKHELTQRENKIMRKLETSTQRYADVFQRLGFPVELKFSSIFGEEEGDMGSLAGIVGAKNDDEWIGIAPFAKHTGKIYPTALTEKVISLLCKQPHRRIFIFGGGEAEKEIAQTWAKRYKAVTEMIGKGLFIDELGVISRMDVMMSMDSANMHLASIAGVPVVSIWGATHPNAGFTGWNQKPETYIQTDLKCRPCSVYGNKPCFRNDYACLNRIDPDRIAEKIESLLETQNLKKRK